MTNLSNIAKSLNQESISSILFEYLDDYGLNKKLIDVVLCESGIYAILSDGKMIKTVMHKNLIDIKEYKKSGAPLFHIFGCKFLKEAEKEEKIEEYKISFKRANSFNFIVREGNREIKVFHDISLELCPECMKMQEKSLDFDSFFQSVFDCLDLQKRKRDVELISIIYKKLKHFSCEKCNKKVSIQDIEDLKLKIYKDSSILKNGAKLKILCKECV